MGVDTKWSLSYNTHTRLNDTWIRRRVNAKPNENQGSYPIRSCRKAETERKSYRIARRWPVPVCCVGWPKLNWEKRPVFHTALSLELSTFTNFLFPASMTGSSPDLINPRTKWIVIGDRRRQLWPGSRGKKVRRCLRNVMVSGGYAVRFAGNQSIESRRPRRQLICLFGARSVRESSF